MSHTVENKVLCKINERNVSILWRKDSKILMKMAYLAKFAVKSNFLMFGYHGNQRRAKNDLQLPLIISLTFDEDIEFFF